MKKTPLVLSICIGAVFLALHALGLRAQVGVLSGAIAPGDLVGPTLGILYAISWFLFVLVAPILTLGTLIHHGFVTAARGFRSRRA